MDILRQSGAAKIATEANRNRRNELMKDSGSIWLMNKIFKSIRSAAQLGKSSELIDIKNDQMPNEYVVSDEILDAICWFLTAIEYEVSTHKLECMLEISWGDKKC